MFFKTDVYTIERNHNLFRSTTKLFNRLNINPIRFKYGDGYKGLIDDSPFDGILITAGSPNVPEDLLKQLKVGGRMVVPIGKKIQVMTKITRISINNFKKETFGNFKFVPMLKKKD
jgi:Protein-L-isoaspartate carboxylmethyltransferase